MMIQALITIFRDCKVGLGVSPTAPDVTRTFTCSNIPTLQQPRDQRP